MKSFHLRTILAAFAIGCLLAAAAMAAETTLKLSVKAGGHDRANTPITVLVDVPDDAKTVTMTGPDGKEFPGQLTAPGLLNDSAKGKRELHFVLPSLGKGESVDLTATTSTEPLTGRQFAWKDTPGEYAELSCTKCHEEDRPVLRYMYAAYDNSDAQRRHDTYKVFHHLYSPGGEQIVTKGPGGKYTHHRGIFYGFSRTGYEGKNGPTKVDTWHCSGDTHLSHAGFLAEEAGKVLGRHLVAVDWCGSDRAFAKEMRELTAYKVNGGQMIQFNSRLISTGGKVTVDGDPQHAGFQFRASQKVAEGDQKLTYYLRTDGKGAPGETRNWGRGNDECANRPWNAMSFVIDEKRYTAVYIDNPNNPKEARYSERSYGRFGSYFVAEFDEENCLEVSYRLWLQDGEMTVEEASALCADFVDPPEVVVK